MQQNQEKPLYKSYRSSERPLPTIETYTKGQILSDHLPQAMPITNMVEGPHLLTWNITRQWTTQNNPTRTAETDDEYLERLIKIGDELANILEENDFIGIAALQEVPDNAQLRNKLLNYLKTKDIFKSWDFDKVFYKKTGDSHGILTFYEKNLVTSATQANLEHLAAQKDHVLATDFTLKENNRNHFIRIVNCHFTADPSSSQGRTFETIQNEIKTIFKSSKGQVLVAGDFNQDLKTIGEPLKNCYLSDQATSVNYNPQMKVMNNHSTDGFIFKHAPETFDLTGQISSDSKPQVVAEFTKTISRADLISHFTNLRYQVKFSKDNSCATLIKEDGTNEIKIQKNPDDRLEFTANNNNEDTLKTLIEAVTKCAPKGVELEIDAVGGNEEQRKDLKNKLWLQAAMQGYSTNYQPPQEFIDLLPPNIKARLPNASHPTPKPR